MKVTTIRKVGQNGAIQWSAWIGSSVFLPALIWMAFAGSLAGAPVKYPSLVVADSQATVYLFNPQTGERVILSRGTRPYDVAIDGNRNVIYSDTGSLRIILVNARTRQEAVIAQNPGLGVPYGIDVDKHNRIYVANSVAILSIDPATRQVETVAEKEFLKAPLDVAVAPDGSLYVADALAGIIRIDAGTRRQTVVAAVTQDGLLRNPVGIAIVGNHSLYVADSGGGCIVRINLPDYSQKLVSKAGNLLTPVGVVVGPADTILVSDPDALDLDGAVFAISPDGTQTPILRGTGQLVNPRGIAILPAAIDPTEIPRAAP